MFKNNLFCFGFFPQDWKRTKSRCHVASPTWLLPLGGEWKMAGVEEGTKCNQSAAKVPEIKGLESSRQNHMLFNTRTQLAQQNLQLLPKLLSEWKGGWLQKWFELDCDSEKGTGSCESFSHQPGPEAQLHGRMWSQWNGGALPLPPVHREVWATRLVKDTTTNPRTSPFPDTTETPPFQLPHRQECKWSKQHLRLDKSSSLLFNSPC